MSNQKKWSSNMRHTQQSVWQHQYLPTVWQLEKNEVWVQSDKPWSCMKHEESLLVIEDWPLVPTQSLFTLTHNDHERPWSLKKTHFCVLVIGRANAGKTTLLQRVCNTTEDPCIYDENNRNLVSVRRTEDEFYTWYFLLSLNLPRRYSTSYYR